jgi:hypothetical protein
MLTGPHITRRCNDDDDESKCYQGDEYVVPKFLSRLSYTSSLFSSLLLLVYLPR